MRLDMTMAALACAALAGCMSVAVPRYVPVEKNQPSLRALVGKDVAIAKFTRSGSFNPLCRQAALIDAPTGASFESYIGDALEAELKAAGLITQGAPAVVISGDVTKLEFGTMANLVGGDWTIEVSLRSSNGKSASFTERREFNAGFIGTEACRNTTDAFLPTVENLIAKILSSAEFAAMLTTPN